MAGALPTYDYEQEQASIERRRKLAEAMLSGGLAPAEPTQVVTGYAVRQSPLTPIAKIVQAYLGTKGIQTADDAQKNLGARYKADLSSQMSQFIDGISTQPGTAPSQTGNNPSAYVAPTEVTPADAAAARRKAILDAIASGHPVMQQLGMSQFQQLSKQGLSVEKLLAHATPESQQMMVRTGDTAYFKPDPKLKALTPGEVLIDGGGNIATPGSKTGGAGGSSGPIVPRGWKLEGVQDGIALSRDPSGDLYQQTATGWKKLDNAPKTTVTANVTNLGQKAGMAEWAKKVADQVSDMSKASHQANKLLSQLDSLEKLSAAGTNNGPTAEIANFIQGLAKTAGIPVDAAKLNNSQAFNSVATQAWAALMQQNGGARGLVKEESEKLAQSLPSLVQTPQGRAQIIATLRRAAQQDIANAALANRQYGEALNADDPRLFTFGLSAASQPQLPPTSAPPGSVSPGKPSVSNWPGAR